MSKELPDPSRSVDSQTDAAGTDLRSIARRPVLAAVAGAGIATLAGCTGDGGGDEDEDGDDPEPALAVSTGEATDVEATAATLVGEVDELEAIDEVAVGFEYGPANGDLANSVDAGTLDATDSFEQTVADLDPETDYEFRATATADERSEVGDAVGFTTGELVPDHTVRVHGVQFTPDELTITVGEVVEWVFEGGGHNVYPTDIPDESDWEGTEGFDQYPKGHVHVHRFEVPGTYDYHCQPHSNLGMEGTIIVEED